MLNMTGLCQSEIGTVFSVTFLFKHVNVFWSAFSSNIAYTASNRNED